MSHFHSLRKLFNINTIFSTGKEEHGKSPHFIYTLPNFKSSSVHGQSFYILVRVRTCCFYFLCLHSWKKRTHISSALNKQLYFWHFWAAIVFEERGRGQGGCSFLTPSNCVTPANALQFHSVLTLSPRREHLIPQVKGLSPTRLTLTADAN